MGMLKRLRRKEKKENKNQQERIKAYFEELKLLNEKYHLDIGAELQITRDFIRPMPFVKELEEKPKYEIKTKEEEEEKKEEKLGQKAKEG